MSAVEKTRLILTEIERANSRLKAFCRITSEMALADAARVDALAAAGAGGPLAGLPVAVKDIIDVAGVPTQAGSLTRRDAKAATADAQVVARLRAAGAIIVGKTNTVEFAFGGWGTNVTVGTPRNPWDKAVHRVPGGSSSGSGVAVGAGLVPAALGTDTGGSVRGPAALNGCVGLKTTLGLVGRSGVVPLSETLDSVGPMARDVATAARMLAVMQGPDGLDPSTAGAPLADPLASLERGAQGLRIGRFADEDLPQLSSDAGAALARAGKLLTDAGATITRFKPPEPLEAYMRACGTIIAAEGYATYRHLVDDDASGLAPPIRTRFKAARAIGAADYIATLKARSRAIAAFLAAMDRCDAIILPTTPFPAIALAEVDEGQTPMGLYTRFVNYVDLAGLAVPIGVAGSGMPTSLQILVRRFDDPLALRIGRALEVARGTFPTAPA